LNITGANEVINNGPLYISTTGNDNFNAPGSNDTVSYVFASSAVSVSLAVNNAQNTGMGTDTLRGFENVIGSNFNDTLTGSNGRNILDGGIGADTMKGGAGDDTYIVDNTGDLVIEAANGGADLVQSTVNYMLPVNVESLTLLGTGNINATGNGDANYLIGNSGNNRLDGGAGIDSLTGGAGNDTYVVDSTKEILIEKANEGIDTVESSLTWTLANNFENLTLTGLTATNGTGNTLDNIIIGNSVINTLSGDAGNDTLNGGLGKDILTGGTGADHFQFTSTLGNVNADTLTDFVKGADKIDLSRAIFTAFGGQSISSALNNNEIGNHLLYNKSTGILSYDADGSAGSGAAVQVALLGTGSHPSSLQGSDFMIVA
jgi:Ca2+-binding RTX toxin-like protein